MEGLPSGMAVADSGEAVNVPQDGLAFAVSEDNGLNYAYIIHLPVDGVHVHEQILVNNVLDQENLIVETKHHGNLNFSEQSFGEIASNSEIALPTSNNNTCDEMISLSQSSGLTTTTTGESGEIAAVLPENSPVLQSHPIEIHYLQEMPPFGDDNQKCDVENFLQASQEQVNTSEIDIKYDPTNISTTDIVTDHDAFSELSDQKNVSLSFGGTVDKEVFPCDTNDISSSINATQEPKRLSGKINNNLVKVQSTYLSKSCRTYGKPKMVKETPVIDPPLSETPQSTISTNKAKFPAKISSARVTKVLRIAEVHVKQSQRVTIPIPVRKRRLILDTQKQIPIPEFKRQLTNTKDIVHVRSELAPCTKQALKCLAQGGVAQFFSSPGRPIHNKRLSKLFTNHLVMLTNSENCSPTSNSVPLNADLRIPQILKNEDHGSNNLNSDDSNSTTSPAKRLNNATKPLDPILKGLRRTPIFKEYKRMQRKFTVRNGDTRPIQSRHISGAKIDNRVEARSDSVAKVKLPKGDAKIKVEEVVYTLEEGESVVLKSCGIIDSEPSNSDQGNNADSELLLDTSTNNQEAIKTEKGCTEGSVPSDGLEEVGPKDKTDTHFTANYMEFYDDSYSLVVKDAESKSIDLQGENDLKLWSDEASNS